MRRREGGGGGLSRPEFPQSLTIHSVPEPSNSLQAQHKATISALKSNVTALETLVSSSQSHSPPQSQSTHHHHPHQVCVSSRRQNRYVLQIRDRIGNHKGRRNENWDSRPRLRCGTGQFALVQQGQRHALGRAVIRMEGADWLHRPVRVV
jgi:hypothetical protein